MARKKFERKKKTFEQVCKWNENDLYVNEDTGIYLYMETAPEHLFALGDLFYKFYLRNEGLQPITFQLVKDNSQAIEQQDWYAVMYGGWHIRILEGRSRSGPHQTQLWYKSHSMKKNFWVATLQLEAFFYNENEMREALLKAIAERQFFITDQDRDVLITL